MGFAELPRSRRLALLLAVAGIGCSLVLLLAEVGVRVRALVKHGSVWGVSGLLTIDKTTRLRILEPGARVGAIEINSHGFRGPEIEPQKPAGTVRIAFLGASTTFCAEASSTATTWPALVVERFRQLEPGARFDYVNGGVPGYGVTDSLANLRHRVARFAPDAIVIYHATNDLSGNTFDVAREQGAIRDRPDRERSWLSEYSLLVRLVELNWTIRSRKERVDEAQGKLRMDLPRLSAPFRHDLTALVAEARSRAPLVAVVTFSTQYRRGQPRAAQLAAAETSLYYMPYMTIETLLDGFDAYNDVIEEVAAGQGVLLVSGADEIPGDPAHFVDSVHFTDAGNAAMASRVSRAFEASPVFREIVARARRATEPGA